MTENLLVEARYIGIPEALLDALIGFAVVFLGISILIAVVWLVGAILKKTSEKGEKKKAATAVAETPEISVAAEEDDDELVAVITAAVAAIYKKEGSKCEFVVRHIKRI
ncbi:MAG TPA: hypothetical protein DDW54_04615 [Clostridiales bacterium]|nr:hypothetical protein [Clostridiales bacterium]